MGHGESWALQTTCLQNAKMSLALPDLQSASEPRGYYHHCLGRDVSSSAAIAAYFAVRCTSAQLPMLMCDKLPHEADDVICTV